MHSCCSSRTSRWSRQCGTLVRPCCITSSTNGKAL
jgi:hypothetical protein